MPVVTFLHNHILAGSVTHSKWTCAKNMFLFIYNLPRNYNMWKKEYNFQCITIMFISVSKSALSHLCKKKKYIYI